MSRAYYNEHDRFAAAWLRELIADGLIAPGDVDERDIQDVTPADVMGYTQCHWFAGIGVWSLALRLAGWPDDRPIWTGSCPCQPFSAAGKGAGLADERHLWPSLYWLIGECRPPIVIGEQVSSADGLGWLDVVLADLDQAGYTGGAVDTCAAGFGAPHIRQRLYWMGYAEISRSRALHGQSNARRQQQESDRGSSVSGRVAHANDARLERRRGVSERADECVVGERGMDGRLEYAASGGCGISGDEAFARDSGHADGAGGSHGRMADADAAGPSLERCELRQDSDAQSRRHADGRGENDRPGPTNGLWRDTDWLGCRDGKWRPVEPGTFPLVAARSVRNRVGKLRGAGNALNVAQAEGFVRAMMETI